jgi:hypothetical protein
VVVGLTRKIAAFQPPMALPDAYDQVLIDPISHPLTHWEVSGPGVVETCLCGTCSHVPRTVLEATVLEADDYLLGTPADLGCLSGALKHYFARYPAIR